MKTRRKKDLIRFGRITQFGYWDLTDDAEEHAEAHKALSAYYEKKQRADAGAVFEYGRADFMAPQALWVGKLLTQWGRAGEKSKLVRFITVLSDRRGSHVFGEKADVVGVIRRDQGIFQMVVDRWLKGGLPLRPTETKPGSCYGVAAKKYRTTEATVHAVVQNYKSFLARAFRQDRDQWKFRVWIELNRRKAYALLKSKLSNVERMVRAKRL